ncbi:glycolytic proteins transcriptional activator gcr1 [Paramecium bursaria]
MQQHMDQKVYYVLLLITAIFSMLGSLYIIASYWKYRESANIATKLINILASADLLFVLSTIINPNPDKDNFLCEFQAWLKQFSSQSAFIASTLISFYIYQSIVKGFKIETGEYTRAVYLACLFPPFLTATIPLVAQGYGNNNYTCFFREDDKNIWIESLFLLYLPLLSMITISLLFVLKVIRYLRRIAQEIQFNDRFGESILNVNRFEEIQSVLATEKVVKLIILYPIILAACWWPFIFYAIIQASSDGSDDFLFFEGIRTISACSQGFFNAIIHYKCKVAYGTQVVPSNTRESIDESEIYYGSRISSSGL